jgi:UTP--glucose-1-phosphate uridylyltransferase
VDIYYVRQKEAFGLGHAIYSARKFIGSEPFAVLLETTSSIPKFPVSNR